MKIKDVKGERSFTILKDLIPHVERLGSNKPLCDIYNTDGLPDDDRERAEIIAERIASAMPDLISGAKDDLVGYLSTLEGVTPEEYEKDISAGKLIGGVMDMLADSYFRAFFTRFLKRLAQG